MKGVTIKSMSTNDRLMAGRRGRKSLTEDMVSSLEDRATKSSPSCCGTLAMCSLHIFSITSRMRMRCPRANCTRGNTWNETHTTITITVSKCDHSLHKFQVYCRILQHCRYLKHLLGGESSIQFAGIHTRF